MQNILFTNKDTYSKVDVKKLSDHTILIITNEQPNISGFCLVTDTDEIYGKYYEYTTLYRKIDDGYILSNDGSIYVEPDPEIPVEEQTYEPTIDEIKNKKRMEIESCYLQLYSFGTDATLSDQSIIHIPNIDNDMLIAIGTAYNSAIVLLESGSTDTKIPFDISQVCNSYIPLDIMKIYISIQSLVIYNRSLKNELLSTLDRCDSIESINNLIYNENSLDEVSLSLFKKSINDGQNVINEILSKYISAGENA